MNKYVILNKVWSEEGIFNLVS